MIRRVERLRKFGIYRDFSGGEASGLTAFNKINLIYGWNYSGKTTLSRVFQALERKRISREYAMASFAIAQDDGSILNSNDLSLAPTVRVFNRDYVSENFEQEHSAPAVFIVGQENVALKARHAQLQGRRERVEKLANDINSMQDAITTEVSNLGTNKARDIGNLLGDRNFRRPNLDQRIREVRQNTASYILTDETVQARLATLRSTDDYRELPSLSLLLPDLAKLSQGINALLSQTASNRAIEQFSRDVRLEGWVRQGLALHQDADMCNFCGSPLTTERLEILGAHFSEAYEMVLRDLEQKIEQVNGISLDVPLPHERDLMPDLRIQFAGLRENLDDWLVWAGQTRDAFVAILSQKRNTVETKSTWNGDLTRVVEADSIISAFNTVFESHNELVRNIDRTKVDAKQALELHYAALHFEENQLERNEQELVDLQARIKRSAEVKDRIAQAIRAIDNQISRSAIGVTKLNELLNYLLVGSDIEVESVGDSEFRFIRGGEVATNLSEGEKTAVTFAYFLTTLEAGGSSPEDAIVFVDDPISSLDSNHIYAVYALITERLEKSQQLFVSTHNSEFFNLLKGRWLNQRVRGMRGNTSAYYIARITDTNGLNYAQLSDLPRLLRKYKSEYEFVFSHLYEFSHTDNPSEHEAYTAPNLLRKFLESYLGFRKPSVTVWHEKLNLLFDSVERQREVHKFADDASHLQSLNRSLQQPAFVSSAQRLVGDVINALHEKDPDHHASLLEVINGGNP